MDVAVAFARDRGVRIFCGELGVYKPNSAEADRVRWYRDVRTYLEKAGVAWTSWDYHGAFGLFKDIGGGRFGHDLDVPLVEALGFTAPPQKTRATAPESGPAVIYGDFPASGILVEGWQKSGLIDFYSTADPFSGKYSIRWEDAAQYDSFLFIFETVKDFSLIVNEGYALELKVRMIGRKANFDIRFMNPDSTSADMPWRMVRTIDAELVVPDGRWHLVRIPLAEMTDAGAWKSAENKWYDSRGAFSWADVASLQIAAEKQDLAGTEIGFDDIKIVK